MSFGDLGERESALTVTQHGSTIDVERCAPDPDAFQLRSAHAGTDTFDDQITLEFSDGADDDQHGPAERTAGIDIFPERNELDVAMLQLVDHFQEVPHAASETIESPDYDCVELSAAGIVHHLIEPRSFGFRSRDSIGVLVNDGEAALLRQLAQIMELSFRMLVEGADSQVERCAFRGHSWIHWVRRVPWSGFMTSR